MKLIPFTRIPCPSPAGEATPMDPTSLLLSYQLAEYLEGVTDKIEDSADFIKVIAIRSK